MVRSVRSTCHAISGRGLADHLHRQPHPCFVLQGCLTHRKTSPRVVLSITVTWSLIPTYHSEMGSKIVRRRLTQIARPEHPALQEHPTHKKSRNLLGPP